MKPIMLYAIIAVAAIAIVAGFGFQLGSTEMPELSESMAANVLFVCPAQSTTWDSIAFALRPFLRYIVGGAFFVVVLLMFGWGWQLYQNMLSDKFKRDSFKNIWGYTKLAFWAGVIVLLIVATPNSFRRVEITGAGNNWVLCDGNTPGARAVRADAVHAR